MLRLSARWFVGGGFASRRLGSPSVGRPSAFNFREQHDGIGASGFKHADTLKPPEPPAAVPGTS